MKLGIFFLATNVYKKYFEEYARSLVNVFPNNNVEKELFIMSDGLREYDGKQMFGCNIHWIKTIDFPYPLVPCNKFQIVVEYMKEYGLEYGMFTDIDTIFLKKSHEFWEDLKRKIMSGKMLCSGHPHYLYYDRYDLEETDPIVVLNKESQAYVDFNIINEHQSYIITSFFAGTLSAIEEYAVKIYKLLGFDLNNLRWMPVCVDEAYLNRIYIDEITSEAGTNMLKEKYITMNPYFFPGSRPRSNDNIYENNFPEIDTIFMNQKFNTGLKEIKKSNTV